MVSDTQQTEIKKKTVKKPNKVIEKKNLKIENDQYFLIGGLVFINYIK